MAQKAVPSGTGLTVERPWTLSPDPSRLRRRSADGGQLNSGQHRQDPDPGGERDPVAAATPTETEGCQRRGACSRRTVECPPRCQRGDRRFESGRERVRRPHEVGEACRILSPVARVQVPVGVRSRRACGAIGSAPALHAGGSGFESPWVHANEVLMGAQQSSTLRDRVRLPAFAPSPPGGTGRHTRLRSARPQGVPVRLRGRVPTGCWAAAARLFWVQEIGGSSPSFRTVDSWRNGQRARPIRGRFLVQIQASRPGGCTSGGRGPG